MSLALKLALIGIALLGPPVGYVFYQASLSSHDWVYQGPPSDWKDGGIHGAPGPIAGAGLPIVAAVGFGAYWLVRRYRRKSD
jgi:drug/metabolite transporter (DMT)-like permease